MLSAVKFSQNCVSSLVICLRDERRHVHSNIWPWPEEMTSVMVDNPISTFVVTVRLSARQTLLL